MSNRPDVVVGRALVAAASLLAAVAMAQPYPSKPVRVIVPYSAGGGTDVLARLVTQKLGERLGQPLLVENRTGAGGAIGTTAVIKSAPDGYTLLFNNETLAVAPNVSRNVPYDAARDLAPIGLVAESTLVIGVSSTVQATTLRELIAMAKAQPGKLAYSSCGNGTMMHLAGELLKLSAEIDMGHVPYRGCAPAMQDSASGQVPVFVSSLANVSKLEKQGRVRMLAIGSPRRSGLEPNVPTVSESGFPGYEAAAWMALFAPAGTPPELIERVAGELRQAVEAKDVSERIRGLMYEPRPSSPQELSTTLRNDLARWARVAKLARIEAE